MKKLIAILLALCICFSLAACAGKSGGEEKPADTTPSSDTKPADTTPSSDTAPAAEPEKEEDPMATTLVLGAKADFTSEGKNMVFDTLMWRDTSYEASPYVISTEPSDNYTKYTIKVTPGIQFTDGTPVTAEVIKYSIETLGPANNLGYIVSMESVDVIDDLTLEMKFSEPYMGLDYNLSYVYCIKPGSATEEGSITEYIGTGPYILVDHQPDTSATFEVNENYWNEAKKPTNVKTVIWKVIPEESARIMALEKKEVDALGPDSHAGAYVSYSLLPELMAEEGITVDIRNESGSPNTYMYNWKQGFMADLELRKAVTLAIDRQAMVDGVTYGIGYPMYTFLSDDAQYAQRNGEHFDYDPDLAKQILADAGYVDTNNDGIVEKDGKEVILQLRTLSSESYRTTAVLFAESLAAIGIGCEISALEYSAFSEYTTAGDFDVCMVHPWTTAVAYFTSMGIATEYTGWGTGWCLVPEFLDYAKEILASTDSDEIQGYFDKIWAEIYADYPAIPLFATGIHYLYTDEVSGFLWTRGTSNLIDFSEVVINRK